VFAVYAAHANADQPLTALRIGERPDPAVPPGWVRVQVRAASINHHDVWTLMGVGIKPDDFPMILGCDAAGVAADGSEVIVHSVIGQGEDETLDPHRTLLSEKYQGTFADYVVVPGRNVLPKPGELSWAEAACLPTAWLTAYRMLVTRGALQPGETILIQGAGGGVATACIVLGRALGLRVWVTSRDDARRATALELGADAVFASGARLPERVDAVMETVGAATWEHSVKSLRPGGRIVISGATSGANPPAELTRIFFKQLSVIGSTMGTRDELEALVDLCLQTGVRPLIDRTLPMTDAAEGLAAVASGNVVGKIVLTRPGTGHNTGADPQS